MTRRLMCEAVWVSVEDWGRVYWNLFSRSAHPNKSLDPIGPARGQRVSSTVQRQSVEFCWMTIYSVADWMQLSSSVHLQRFLHRQKNRMGRDVRNWTLVLSRSLDRATMKVEMLIGKRGSSTARG